MEGSLGFFKIFDDVRPRSFSVSQSPCEFFFVIADLYSLSKTFESALYNVFSKSHLCTLTTVMYVLVRN